MQEEYLIKAEFMIPQDVDQQQQQATTGYKSLFKGKENQSNDGWLAAAQ